MSISLQELQKQGEIKTIYHPNISLADLQKQGNINIGLTPAKTGFWGSVGNGIVNGVKAVGNALTSSEQAFGNTLGTAASVVSPEVNKNRDAVINQANSQSTLFLKNAQAEKDPAKKQHWIQAAMNAAQTSGEDIFNNPEYQKTAKQIAGEGLGVALDIALTGSYGKAAKGAETGKLLVKSGGLVENLAAKTGIATSKKIVTPVVTGVAKQTLGQTLKTIGTKTAVRSGVGAGTGYGYDVSQNLQSGKTGSDVLKPGMGTILGGSIPLVIGGIQAGVAITKETAPKFINSLIKPKQADFSYGKDPGRTVSEMGITGNSLNDFSNNIHTAKQDVGSQIGDIYSSPANANIKINANDEIAKIDTAIQAAAKGGKENQGIVTTLQNTKDALLYEHGIDANGNIVKIGTQSRNLSNLSPQEAFDFKKIVAEHTKFTGKPSDDKTVNSVLKDIYGGLKEKLNTAVGVNNPEIENLNQKYADLTSAELATRNREAIVKRANMLSLPNVIEGSTAITAAILSGGHNIPTLLAGVGAVGLEKALSSTAVRTRVAAWLGSESPSVIAKVLQQNPGIKTVLYRVLPKFASQLGK